MREFLVLTLPTSFLPDFQSSFVILTSEGEIFVYWDGAYYPIRVTEDGRFEFNPEIDISSDLIQEFLRWAFKTSFLKNSNDT